MSKKEELIPEDKTFQIGQKVFYVRFHPNNGIAEILEMKISKLDDTYAVAIISNERDSRHSQRWIISNKYLGDIVFHERKNALAKLKQMQKDAHYVEKQFTVAEEPYDIEEEE